MNINPRLVKSRQEISHGLNDESRDDVAEAFRIIFSHKNRLQKQTKPQTARQQLDIPSLARQMSMHRSVPRE